MISTTLDDYLRATQQPNTLVEVLRRRANEHPGKSAYTFLADGQNERASLSFGELDAQARSIASLLQNWGASGQRVLLLYQPSLEFVAAFFGCLYAGAIAVPAQPPRQNRSSLRLRSIIEDADPSMLLTTDAIASKLRSELKSDDSLNSMYWLTSNAVALELGEEWEEPEIDGETLAFLQYTSGSTASPRGVMVSHGNLLANEKMIQEAFRQTHESIICGWLPLHHDMGLIGNVLQPLYLGASCILMSPASFLQKPYRWLKAISDYRVTTSGAPNFAYDLCTRRVTAEERATLDLSSWTTAFNGAEPVREETMERFASAFASCGFRSEAFFPCYGLAEATLLVSCGPKQAPLLVSKEGLKRNEVALVDRADDAQAAVSCGPFSSDQQVIVVDPENLRPSDPETIGEIWVAGKNVAHGYWNRIAETAETFHAYLPETSEGPFLRTGDLGFIRDGELFITGRIKDLIVIRGANHYPQDIELTVEKSHSGLQAAGCAAFSVDAGGEERLVIVQELAHRTSEPQALVDAIRERVAREHDLHVYAIVLIRRLGLPKTTSGKVQRRLCRQQFLDGSLATEFVWRESVAMDQTPEMDTPPVVSCRTCGVAERLKTRLAAMLKIDVTEIDPAQPLIHYGLDSLMAVELAYQIESEFRIVLSSATLLQDTSIEKLAAMAAKQPPVANPLQSAKQIHGDFKLSHGQEALWFLHKLEPRSPAYNIVSAASVIGELDIPAFRRALQHLVDRHPALRTTFGSKDGRPFQRVHEKANVFFAQEDASKWDDATLQQRIGEEAMRPFDLERGPLVRVVLFNRGTADRIVLLAMHHIISDFWSVGILVHELGDLYRAERSGKVISLPAPPVQYTDFAVWQSEMLASDEGERLWSYWQKQLSGELPVVELPADRPRPAVQTHRGAAHRFAISDELTRRLRELSRSSHTTLYTTLLAAFQTLLQRYTGADDILIGSPMAGRNRVELGSLIGYFANPVVIRGDLSGDLSFEALLRQTRERVLEAQSHQEFPFASIVERLQPVRQAGRAPLFQVSFVLQREHPLQSKGLSQFALGIPGTRIDVGGLVLESYELDQRISPFDLTLMVAEADEDVTAVFEYDRELFDASTIERMGRHFITLLEGVIADPSRQIRTLGLMSEAERRQIVFDWNETSVEYRQDVCLHQLFEAQVERTPQSTAVVFEDRKLTYAELNRRANSLARRLRSLGASADSIVGICMERSLEMVVACFAVLKAGAAYLPLEPSLPHGRLRQIIADAGTQCVLTQQHVIEKLAGEDVTLVAVDSEWEQIAKHRDEDLHIAIAPDNLAYVLYTSGSTGVPKGVMISHRSICNHMLWMQDTFEFSEADRILQKTPFSFDASVWEFYAPLFVGACLVMARPWEHTNPAYLVQKVADEGITVLQLVPSMLTQMLQRQDLDECRGLRTVFCGGEALSRTLMDDFFSKLSAGLCNLYGPTEASIDAVIWTCSSEDGGHSVPIGRPVANTRAYVVDAVGEVVPVGVNGELLLGGAGLARGYLQRAELTAERFIPDGFSGRAGGRLYRTGDLCRYRADGVLEYLGRLDQQVKVRGYRIELGEVESVLSSHPDVRECAVMVNQQRLLGYVVTDADASELRRFMGQRLPEYMVPAQFVPVARLPLNANGKVDRKALAHAESSDSRTEYRAPRTPFEEIVCGVWAEVLDVERVGSGDNFFELGGHSLLATQVVSRLRESLGRDVTVRMLFERPTVEELARELEQGTARTTSENAITPREHADEPAALSFAQQRLWFLQQLEPSSAAYNMPATAHIHGPLSVPTLERAIAEIIQRHEVLRTRFVEEQGQPKQIAVQFNGFELPLVDLSNSADREAELRRQTAEIGWQPFDLKTEPLLRCRLFRMSEAEHVLLLTVHHIAADGWSVNVLVRELNVVYDAFLNGEPSPLPELPVQYADYAQWQRGSLNDPSLDAQLDYWKEQLAGAPEVLEVPADHPRPKVRTANGRRSALTLSRDLTDRLRGLSRKQNSTLYMVVLAAFKTFLHRYTGQTDIVVGTPVANRHRREIEGLIGFFVNTLVLRTAVDADATFVEVLGRVRETCLSAYVHQEAPFEKLVEKLLPERSLSHTPLFQVMLVMQDEQRLDHEPSQLNLIPKPIEGSTAKCDLTLSLSDKEDGLSGYVEYSTDLFEPETIEQMLRHFTALLEAIVTNPHATVSALPLLSDAERRQLLTDCNQTGNTGAPARCIHELFEQQVKNTPRATAVIFENEQLTYRELNSRANQLAHRLIGLGVGPEVLVGLCMERSIEMVIGLLGILKAGGAYVPLDPKNPAARLDFILEDTGAQLVVTKEAYRHLFSRTLCLDTEWPAIESAANPVNTATPANSVYVIYTSGSTGQPKGVVVEHRQLANYVHAFQSRLELAPGLSYAMVQPLTFDGCNAALYPSLLSGGRLHLISEERATDANLLGSYMADHQIDVLKISPSHLAAMQGSMENILPRSLLVLGGEPVRSTVDCRTFNQYGPTETTVAVTGTTDIKPNSIGKPLAGSRVFVLDQKFEPVPLGVAGELYVAGAGLTRGYLNRPELTAQSFIPNPFSSTPGARLYRTGDVARRLRDGNLEFLGRADHQVKIRGLRIELGEIETALSSYPAVRQAVVSAHENRNGDKRLVAYVVATPGLSVTLDGIQEWLRPTLPDYMVPSALVLLDAMPLNASGKIDRKRLPHPEFASLQTEKVAPRTDTETMLAKIWSELLDLDRVGVHDNFFQLGGHSLLATQLLSRTRETFAIDLPVRTLFENPTIAALGELVDDASRRRAPRNMPKIKPRIRGKRTLDHLLASIETLSQEEAGRMLGRDAELFEGGIVK